MEIWPILLFAIWIYNTLFLFFWLNNLFVLYLFCKYLFCLFLFWYDVSTFFIMCLVLFHVSRTCGFTNFLNCIHPLHFQIGSLVFIVGYNLHSQLEYPNESSFVLTKILHLQALTCFELLNIHIGWKQQLYLHTTLPPTSLISTLLLCMPYPTFSWNKS